ncbi:tripartite tricarboxylate transporter substrate binding protein BugE [Lacisediminimonas profundi]|uniref:tripartite tricarboxylate transporter substrate binding protein BugE n=1 Tax=Lacisediminimonas profundi TaxID=2603856 RepID=UPI00124B5896|nr:tripartite tricarboxylate transporter substrate binding protein BugE [Lacisediminimonas profundi]
MATTAASAQSYPTKPIRLIIPFPPGGTTDIIGRAVGDRLSRELGQPVIIDNRGGGGGSIGAVAIAKADPDGYTIGMATVSTQAVNPACNPKLPYDPVKDFVAITNLARTPNVMVVNPKFPAQDYKQLLAVLKKNPGKYGYATSGTCGIGHLMGEKFKASTGTFMVHIPYRGAGPALNDVLGGQVEVMFDNLPSSFGFIQNNRLRPIAVAWPKRLESLPNVPTFAELGLKMVNDPAWYGLIAPAKTPEDIVRKIHDAAVKALNSPEVQARVKASGSEIVGNTPAEFAAEMRGELQRAQDVVKKQGIKIDASGG